jgi:CO dehydrogenase/acetyl-CoA synthase delta subunit
VADNLSHQERCLQYVLSELNERNAQVLEALDAVLWILIEQEHEDLAHVVRQDEVLEEEWRVVHVVIDALLVQVVLGNVPADQGSRGAAEQHLVHDGADRVQIAELGDRSLVPQPEEKLFDLVRIQVDLPVPVRHNDVRQLGEDGQLLR